MSYVKSFFPFSPHSRSFDYVRMDQKWTRRQNERSPAWKMENGKWTKQLSTFRRRYHFHISVNLKSLFTLRILFFQVLSSMFGYILCWLACTMNLQKICFVIPLLLSTPVAIMVVITQPHYLFTGYHDDKGSGTESWVWWQVVVLGVSMWLSQVVTLNYEAFKSQQFLMAREELLFWMPSYNGILY